MNSTDYSTAIKFMIVLRQKKKIILLRKAKQLDDNLSKGTVLKCSAKVVNFYSLPIFYPILLTKV